MAISAVGWNRQRLTEGSASEVLLGTEAGTLHELWIEDYMKKSGTWRQLCDLGGSLGSSRREAIHGVQVEVRQGGRDVAGCSGVGVV